MVRKRIAMIVAIIVIVFAVYEGIEYYCNKKKQEDNVVVQGSCSSLYCWCEKYKSCAKQCNDC